MTSRPARFIRRVLPGLALLSLPPALSACSFGGPPPSAEDRETRRDCYAEADRIFAAQNRYQISERDQSDTPYAGNTLPSNPTTGLSDQYARDKLVDSCLAHGGAGAPSGPASSSPSSTSPSSTGAPPGGPATRTVASPNP